MATRLRNRRVTAAPDTVAVSRCCVGFLNLRETGMDINVFMSHELDTVFRVLRTVLAPREVLVEREQKFLETYARITGYALPAGDPELIEPVEVDIEGAHQRKRLVQLAAI